MGCSTGSRCRRVRADAEPSPATNPDVTRPRLPALVALATAAVALAAIALGPPADISPTIWRAGFVSLVATSLWATAVVPEYVGVLVLFFLAMILALVPASVVFSGFHSGAAWMVFGGLVIGASVQATRLGERIAARASGLLAGSYRRILIGLVILTSALAFMPSANGRVLILIPIVIALAERIGFGPGTQGRTGLCLAVAAAAVYGAIPIMPAGVPNLVLMGAAETNLGIHLRYADWLVTHYPVSGLVGLAALPFIVARLFPATVAAAPPPADPTPVSAAQKRLVLYLVAALGLWATDALHGIAPSWIALGVALLCILPGTGVVAANQVLLRINFGLWIFIAGVVGMGLLVSHTGLGAVLGRALFSVVPLEPGADFRNFVVIVAIEMLLALISGTAGLPAIMTPMAPTIAAATGWSVETVLWAQIPAWSMAPFPYQFTPVLLALALAELRAAAALRMMVAFTLFSWIALIPLQFLWWRALGHFG